MSSVIYLNLLDFYVHRCVPSVDHLSKDTGHREKRVGSEVALPQATVATMTLHHQEKCIKILLHKMCKIIKGAL